MNRLRLRELIGVRISPLLTFGLVGLIFLAGYTVASHDYALEIGQMQTKLMAESERLESEINEYRNLISSFSKKGRRKSLGTFTVTAYDPVESCKPFHDGMTSKMIPAGMGVAAVDPGVIPYGTVLYIPELGKYFFASDTGAAMKRGDGRNIDLLMPTVEEALRFGRKHLEVELIDLSRI